MRRNNLIVNGVIIPLVGVLPIGTIDIRGSRALGMATNFIKTNNFRIETFVRKAHSTNSWQSFHRYVPEFRRSSGILLDEHATVRRFPHVLLKSEKAKKAVQEAMETIHKLQGLHSNKVAGKVTYLKKAAI